ncbi:MAG: hypothetical protein V8S24_05880 [Gordonibacter pamelaeae]
MMRDKTYNADFLSFPQQKAAVAAGYGALTNAATCYRRREPSELPQAHARGGRRH